MIPKHFKTTGLLLLLLECSSPSAAQMGPQHLIFKFLTRFSSICRFNFDNCQGRRSCSTNCTPHCFASYQMFTSCYAVDAHSTASIHWTRWDSNKTQENMPPCDGDVGPKWTKINQSGVCKSMWISGLSHMLMCNDVLDKYVYTCKYIHICIYIYICVCIHMYIYIYILIL